MRKLLQLLVAISCLGVLAACDSVSGSSSSSSKKNAALNVQDPELVGTWKGVTTGEDDSCSYIDSMTLTLAANGTYTIVDRVTQQCSGTNEAYTDQQSGSWGASGGRMTIDDGDTTFSVAYVVTSSSLTVTFANATETHVEHYVRVTTPGSGGSNPTAPIAPVFSTSGGTYSSGQTVYIASATSGSDIHYTLDGSTPTASSSLYNGFLTISSSCILKAIAIKDGISSPVTSAAYTIRSGSTSTGSEALVGSWYFIEVDSTSSTPFIMEQTLTFSSNGAFSAAVHFEYQGIEDDTTFVGTWSATATTLTITTGGEASSSSYTIDGSDLTIDSDGEEMVFTRVGGFRSTSAPTASSSGAALVLPGFDPSGFIASRLLRGH